MADPQAERIKELEQAQAALRKRIHHIERHNQYFFRCESGWCNPSFVASNLGENPAMDTLKQLEERSLAAEARNEALLQALKAELERLDYALTHAHRTKTSGAYNQGWTNGKKFALSRVRVFIEKALLDSGSASQEAKTLGGKPLYWQIKSGRKIYQFAKEPKVEPVYELPGLNIGEIVVDELTPPQKEKQ